VVFFKTFKRYSSGHKKSPSAAKLNHIKQVTPKAAHMR